MRSIIKEMRGNSCQKDGLDDRFSLTKYTDIASTFSILKPLFCRFSLNISALISGYGSLRTFVSLDRILRDALALMVHQP